MGKPIDEYPEAAPPEITLQRGAVLYLFPKPHGYCDWSVRWPDQREKDPALAAGGYRLGRASSVEEAEKQGRAAFAAGPAVRAWYGGVG